MKLVQQGSFAYHVTPDDAYEYVNKFYDNRLICELTEVHLIRTNSILSLFVGKNSSLFEMLKVG